MKKSAKRRRHELNHPKKSQQRKLDSLKARKAYKEMGKENNRNKSWTRPVR